LPLPPPVSACRRIGPSAFVLIDAAAKPHPRPPGRPADPVLPAFYLRGAYL
jgi:hypothetical protein